MTLHPVHQAFKNKPPGPRAGVMLDLVHYPARNDVPEFWTLRLYRDNIRSLDLSAEDAVAIHAWVSDILRIMRQVEPNVFPEIVGGRND